MAGRDAQSAATRASPKGRGEPQEQAPHQTSKRERILDAAERLFAEGSFDGVSMRDIAAAAEVRLPLIVYHFETKQKLYRAVFDRRKTLLDARLAALRDPVADGADPIEHIVRAFVLPVTQIQNTEAGICYAKLVAREAADPREAARGIVSDHFDPFAREFIQAIRKALPDNGADYAHWAYLFAVGALVMSVFDSRIERLSDGKIKANDLQSKTKHLVTFIAGGIRAGSARPAD